MKLFEGVRVGDKALEELEKVVIEKDKKVTLQEPVSMESWTHNTNVNVL